MIKRPMSFLSGAEERAPAVDVQGPLGELPVPTLDERVLFYLRAVLGNRDFTEEERSNARNVLLNSMAAEIAAQVFPVEQRSPKEESVEGQGWPIEPKVTGPPPQTVRPKQISVAPFARQRTSILALTVTFGLALIVTAGTLGYRWTYPDKLDEITSPTQLPPPTSSPRSLSTRPAPDKATPKQHAVQIVSQRSEAEVLAVFRRLQDEQPILFGQATLSRIDLGLRGYTARIGPFASEKDAAAVCRALEAADIQCLGQPLQDKEPR